jgi:site-specific recombinase XerD
MIITVRQSKGNKDRVVPISEDLLRLTERYYRQYNPVKYLLNGRFSEQYTESSINQMLKYWAAKCGVRKHIHAHKIRHSFATHLHENGIDLTIIRDLLGHSDVKTTDIYTKTSTAKTRVQSLLIGIDI